LILQQPIANEVDQLVLADLMMLQVSKRLLMKCPKFQVAVDGIQIVPQS
jgi:hypothetical protein